MGASNSSLMQSRYFSPAFNSAIFDGPFRIYFAQFQESMALKVYFLIQKKFGDELIFLKEQSKKLDSNILVMMYPTEEIFTESFLDDDFDESSDVPNHEKLDLEPKYEGILAHRWSRDIVVGVNLFVASNPTKLSSKLNDPAKNLEVAPMNSQTTHIASKADLKMEAQDRKIEEILSVLEFVTKKWQPNLSLEESAFQ